MITPTKAFTTSSGAVFPTILEAQRDELKSTLTTDALKEPPADLLNLILERAETIVDILTMTPTSKPTARAIHGGKKVRKPKTTMLVPSDPSA